MSKQLTFRQGTPTHTIRLGRRINDAANRAGLRAELVSMPGLELIRISRGTLPVMIVDIVDVPESNLDDLPQPLAAPTVKLYIQGIEDISPRFTEALCDEHIEHRYVFVDERFDAHIILQLDRHSQIDSAEANERIGQIVAYRRRTRRRIMEQGLPLIGTPRAHANGYHRNGHGAQTKARTAFGQANLRLRSSGIRVTAN